MHSLTSALDGDKWSALPPGKEPRYPLDRRQGVPQSRIYFKIIFPSTPMSSSGPAYLAAS